VCFWHQTIGLSSLLLGFLFEDSASQSIDFKQVLDVPPRVDPEPEDSSTEDGEHDGHQQVHEEGEEGPAHEDAGHDDQDEHIGDEPGDEKRPVLEHGTEDEKEGREEVQSDGGHKTGQEELVARIIRQPVHQGNHRGGCLCIFDEVIF